MPSYVQPAGTEGHRAALAATESAPTATEGVALQGKRWAWVTAYGGLGAGGTCQFRVYLRQDNPSTSPPTPGAWRLAFAFALTEGERVQRGIYTGADDRIALRLVGAPGAGASMERTLRLLDAAPELEGSALPVAVTGEVEATLAAGAAAIGTVGFTKASIAAEGQASISSGAGGSEVVAARAGRKRLYIRNIGSVAVYVRRKGGTDPTSANSELLYPGDVIDDEGEGVSPDQIKALAASGTGSVYYAEA